MVYSESALIGLTLSVSWLPSASHIDGARYGVFEIPPWVRFQTILSGIYLLTNRIRTDIHIGQRWKGCSWSSGKAIFIIALFPLCKVIRSPSLLVPILVGLSMAGELLCGDLQVSAFKLHMRFHLKWSRLCHLYPCFYFRLPFLRQYGCPMPVRVKVEDGFLSVLLSSFVMEILATSLEGRRSLLGLDSYLLSGLWFTL